MLELEAKKESGITVRISPNMTGNANDAVILRHKSLLSNRQVYKSL